MDIKNLTGIQHIGLPTKDLKKTIAFYEDLGFELVHQAKIPAGGTAAFLQLHSCMLEFWEDAGAPGCAGAIDHISLDVHDVDTAYAQAQAGGYKIITDGIEALPFWEKGIRFFKILGPNAEPIEFCEIIK